MLHTIRPGTHTVTREKSVKKAEPRSPQCAGSPVSGSPKYSCPMTEKMNMSKSIRVSTYIRLFMVLKRAAIRAFEKEKEKKNRHRN